MSYERMKDKVDGRAEDATSVPSSSTASTRSSSSTSWPASEVMQMVDLMTKRLTGQLEGQGLGIELTQSRQGAARREGLRPAARRPAAAPGDPAHDRGRAVARRSSTRSSTPARSSSSTPRTIRTSRARSSCRSTRCRGLHAPGVGRAGRDRRRRRRRRSCRRLNPTASPPSWRRGTGGARHGLPSLAGGAHGRSDPHRGPGVRRAGGAACLVGVLGAWRAPRGRPAGGRRAGALRQRPVPAAAARLAAADGLPPGAIVADHQRRLPGPLADDGDHGHQAPARRVQRTGGADRPQPRRDAVLGAGLAPR